MEQEFLLSGSEKDNEQQKTLNPKMQQTKTIKYGVKVDEMKPKHYYFISYSPITTRFEQ